MVNTVKVLGAVLAQELGALCWRRNLERCVAHYVVNTVFSVCGSNTVFGALCWRNFVGTQSATQRFEMLWEQKTCGIALPHINFWREGIASCCYQ